MTRSMFSPEARFFTVESMPLVWDESQLWLMGREGKVLSPNQEQPWTSAPGTAELTWERWRSFGRGEGSFPTEARELESAPPAGLLVHDASRETERGTPLTGGAK